MVTQGFAVTHKTRGLGDEDGKGRAHNWRQREAPAARRADADPETRSRFLQLEGDRASQVRVGVSQVSVSLVSGHAHALARM